jgi:hypothetical protein
MSLGLEVYSVPWDELLAVPGSRRRKLVTDIGRKHPYLAGIDRLFADWDPPNTCLEAVRQLVFAEELDPGKGSLYAYAVEAICMHLGSYLGASFGTSDEKELDRFLEPLGCPVRLWDLGMRGSPIAIPDPGNPPAVGHWTPDEASAAGEFFADLLDRVRKGSDQKLAHSVGVVYRWLEETFEHEGDGLVGFWY